MMTSVGLIPWSIVAAVIGVVLFILWTCWIINDLQSRIERLERDMDNEKHRQRMGIP